MWRACGWGEDGRGRVRWCCDIYGIVVPSMYVTMRMEMTHPPIPAPSKPEMCVCVYHADLSLVCVECVYAPETDYGLLHMCEWIHSVSNAGKRLSARSITKQPRVITIS